MLSLNSLQNLPKNKIILGALAALCAAQIFACAFQIIRYENILTFGKRIVLPTQSYDPYDPLRGRYITISIPMQTFIIDKTLCKDSCRRDFFVTYEDAGDRLGLSKINDVFLTKPDTELAYIKVWGTFTPHRSSGGKISVYYAFDRYYMREDLAKAVDRDSRLVSSNNNARVVVRALNGKGLIENVIIGDQDQPLKEYLIEEQEEQEERIIQVR